MWAKFQYSHQLQRSNEHGVDWTKLVRGNGIGNVGNQEEFESITRQVEELCIWEKVDQGVPGCDTGVLSHQTKEDLLTDWIMCQAGTTIL